jgi:hypothetical protein
MLCVREASSEEAEQDTIMTTAASTAMLFTTDFIYTQPEVGGFFLRFLLRTM